MRIVSYILMQMAPGKANEAAKTISKIPGVKMAHAVTGPFDVIALADVPDLEALSNLVLSRIQKVQGVEKTQTAVAVVAGKLSDAAGAKSSGKLRPSRDPKRQRK